MQNNCDENVDARISLSRILVKLSLQELGHSQADLRASKIHDSAVEITLGVLVSVIVGAG